MYIKSSAQATRHVSSISNLILAHPVVQRIREPDVSLSVIDRDLEPKRQANGLQQKSPRLLDLRDLAGLGINIVDAILGDCREPDTPIRADGVLRWQAQQRVEVALDLKCLHIHAAHGAADQSREPDLAVAFSANDRGAEQCWVSWQREFLNLFCVGVEAAELLAEELGEVRVAVAGDVHAEWACERSGNVIVGELLGGIVVVSDDVASGLGEEHAIRQSPEIVEWLEIAEWVVGRWREDGHVFCLGVDADQLVADSGGRVHVAICTRSDGASKGAAVLCGVEAGEVGDGERWSGVGDGILFDIAGVWVYREDVVGEDLSRLASTFSGKIRMTIHTSSPQMKPSGPLARSQGPARIDGMS